MLPKLKMTLKTLFSVPFSTMDCFSIFQQIVLVQCHCSHHSRASKEPNVSLRVGRDPTRATRALWTVFCIFQLIVLVFYVSNFVLIQFLIKVEHLASKEPDVSLGVGRDPTRAKSEF